MLVCKYVFFFWVSCFLLTVSNVKAGDAEKIFKDISPGVVLIQDLEGHGSGVALTADGQILTCFHVVNTPLPLKVTAMVTGRGGNRTMTFSNIKLESVHSSYDLAIIRIPLPLGVKLVTPPRDSKLPGTGSDCYVIGSPAGADGDALVNSISTGVIGADERLINGKHYIQTTAPINPGNSGGALVNKNGKVVGIISFIISETEGIGFAIPLAGLNMKDFGPVAKRPIDLKKAIEFEKIGAHWYKQSERLTGDDKESALYFSMTAYRMSLAEVPNDPAPYNNLGNTYRGLGKSTIAIHFYKKAYELTKGKDPLYCKMIGVCYESLDKKEEAAKKYSEALSLTSANSKLDLSIRSECAENLSILSILSDREGALPEASYFVYWANSLSNARNSERELTRNTLIRDAAKKTSPKQIAYLKSKTSGFSSSDMKEYLKESFKATKPNLALKKDVILASALAKTDVFKNAMKDAPELGDKGLIKTLPASPSYCASAYGGVYLVMTFPDIKKIGVFNTVQLKFEKYLPLPSADSIITCGGNRLIVYDPKINIFHLYDMRTFEKTGSRVCKVENLAIMEMGSLTPNQALVVWPAIDNKGPAKLGLMSIPSMNITEFNRIEATTFHSGLFQSDVKNLHARVNSDLSRVVFWRTRQSPNGFYYGIIENGGMRYNYNHRSHGTLNLAQDSSKVIGSLGTIIDIHGNTKDNGAHGIQAVAVDGANMMASCEFRKGALTVSDVVSRTIIHECDLPFKHSNWDKNFSHSSPDLFVRASAHTNRIAVIDPKNMKIGVVKLLNGEATVNQITAIRGETWSRKLNFPEGTKIVVEDGPEGLIFDKESMQLTWEVPNDYSDKDVLMLISVKVPEKEEVYDRIELIVR